VGYDISPRKGVVEKYRNPHGQLKQNLFLPLFNTNFIKNPLADLYTIMMLGPQEFDVLSIKSTDISLDRQALSDADKACRSSEISVDLIIIIVFL
jgi:hypothetical protein